ncbi:MAG: ricin-type beta-trefoil lectin domain protein [Saccharothrix sp.]|nr:ricin-type beta-trefoil lectin domain protein [Saccharothrix sp.]
MGTSSGRPIGTVVLATTLALAGLVPALPGTASAENTGDIRNGSNARCLDVHLPELHQDGARIQLWDCHNGLNQEWDYDEQWRVIHNRESGRCLDADLASIDRNGTRVQLWECHADPNQQWTYDPDTRVLRNAHSGRCLDAKLEEINDNGTPVQLWDCHGDKNQRWYF